MFFAQSCVCVGCFCDWLLNCRCPVLLCHFCDLYRTEKEKALQVLQMVDACPGCLYHMLCMNATCFRQCKARRFRQCKAHSWLCWTLRLATCAPSCYYFCVPVQPLARVLMFMMCWLHNSIVICTILSMEHPPQRRKKQWLSRP